MRAIFVLFLFVSLAGCSSAEEDTVIEDLEEIHDGIEDVPVDRAGRPTVDEDGNSIDIEDRILPEEE